MSDEPKFYGRAQSLDGPRATITPEQRDAYKKDVRVITGRDVDVYKPTTQFLRNMYGHLKRKDVAQEELDDRCAAFDRWFESVRRAAWDEGRNAGVADGFAHEQWLRGEHPQYASTLNPYRDEEP